VNSRLTSHDAYNAPVKHNLEGGIIMSKRALSLFGLLCTVVALPALATSEDAAKKAVPAGEFPQFVRVFGCELIKQDKEIVLKAPNDRAAIVTVKEHKPPFALRIKAKTDSKNLRLYYNLGILIFNWEGNEDELRIHDPATSEQTGIADQGKIEPNTYQDISWEIYPDGMRVLVDGKERARKLGDYENLEASLGIGPAFGSVITLESVRVEALKGKLPE
jgi:hypothetical protein